jgi:hypothetical protein
MHDDPNRPPPPPPHGPLTPPPPPPPSGRDTIEDIASTLRDLFNRVPETVNKAVERAINVKDTTVLVRLNDEASDKLDKLVAAGVFKNRMEATSFLLEEGIKAQAPLFQRIQDKLSEIERIRTELRNSVAPEV